MGSGLMMRSFSTEEVARRNKRATGADHDSLCTPVARAICARVRPLIDTRRARQHPLGRRDTFSERIMLGEQSRAGGRREEKSSRVQTDPARRTPTHAARASRPLRRTFRRAGRTRIVQRKIFLMRIRQLYENKNVPPENGNAAMHKLRGCPPGETRSRA
jgi:hypothetical protein